MANTPKEKFKNHTRFCALLAFSILSSAPLLSTNTEEDDKSPVVRSSKLASYIPENLLEKAKKVALFIADEPDASECLQVQPQEPATNLNDVPVEDTSRALVVAPPRFNFSIPNPFASLTNYMKEVDWRKAALFILDEEVLSKEDSATNKPITSSDESDSSVENSEKNEGDSFRTAIPPTQSVDVHSSQEGIANNGEGDEQSLSHSREQSEVRKNLSLNEDMREDPDSMNVADKSLLEGGGDSSSNAPGDVLDDEESGEVNQENLDTIGKVTSAHASGEHVQEGDEESSVLGKKTQEGDEVNADVGDDDSSFLNPSPVKNTDSQIVPDLTLLSLVADQEVEVGVGDTSPYQSPKKKSEAPVTQVTPKAKIKAPVTQVTPKAKIKAPVTPKTPEQAGFNVKTQTDIGPIYHGLTYSYKNPKGEPKMMPGSRLAHFVEKSPHPKKFVLVEAQSPSKTNRSTPFVIKFNKGVAPSALEESSSESDSSGSEEGSSDESSSNQ